MRVTKRAADVSATMIFSPRALAEELERREESVPCFIVIHGPQQGRQFFVNKPEMCIGREAGADICIQEPSVSRKHARIVITGEAVEIVDTASANGTLVNGQRLNPGEPTVLAREDQITLGGSILKFLPAGDLEIQTFSHMDREANTDPLTQIFNKRYLLDTLEMQVVRARSLNAAFAILFLDLDYFKRVNDTLGHEAGDAVLKEFAGFLRSKVLRASDEFARYGGEEFVVLLPSATAADACKVAERVRAAVETHEFPTARGPVRITVSAGVAEVSDAVASAADLLKAADQALYASKSAGRNRVTRAA